MVYFLGGGAEGDAKKPWLGHDQAGGVAGVGTEKRRAEKRETEKSNGDGV